MPSRRVSLRTLRGTRLERLQSRWEDASSWLSPSPTPRFVGHEEPRYAVKLPSGSETMSMSEGYTRVVCPKCLRPQRTPFDLSPSAMLVCTACLHPFPGSLATEFRKGTDLTCFQCGVTTFCISGSKVTECPNCKIHLAKPHDPEKAKLLAFCGGVAVLVLAGFAHSVATNTTPQFLLWLCIASVFTFFGFVTLAALGY